MLATRRIEYHSMGAAELSGRLKVFSVNLMKISNDLTDPSVDELTEGGIQGAGPAA
jgi:hypothetical protein